MVGGKTTLPNLSTRRAKLTKQFRFLACTTLESFSRHAFKIRNAERYWLPLLSDFSPDCARASLQTLDWQDVYLTGSQKFIEVPLERQRPGRGA